MPMKCNMWNCYKIVYIELLLSWNNLGTFTKAAVYVCVSRKSAAPLVALLSFLVHLKGQLQSSLVWLSVDSVGM